MRGPRKDRSWFDKLTTNGLSEGLSLSNHERSFHSALNLSNQNSLPFALSLSKGERPVLSVE